MVTQRLTFGFLIESYQSCEEKTQSYWQCFCFFIKIFFTLHITLTHLNCACRHMCFATTPSLFSAAKAALYYCVTFRLSNPRLCWKPTLSGHTHFSNETETRNWTVAKVNWFFWLWCCFTFDPVTLNLHIHISLTVYVKCYYGILNWFKSRQKVCNNNNKYYNTGL